MFTLTNASAVSLWGRDWCSTVKQLFQLKCTCLILSDLDWCTGLQYILEYQNTGYFLLFLCIDKRNHFIFYYHVHPKTNVKHFPVIFILCQIDDNQSHRKMSAELPDFKMLNKESRHWSINQKEKHPKKLNSHLTLFFQRNYYWLLPYENIY